jgi:AcrR family transcriptional regulator
MSPNGARATKPRQVSGYNHGRVPRAVRERQLLDVAEQLFIQRGYDGTSIEDLARAAGVSRPIVYGHFGSKDGVYLACLRRIRAAFERDMISAAAGGTGLIEQLDRGANAFYSMLEREPERWSLVYGGATMLLGSLADELTDLRFATVDRIAAIIRPHMLDADPERVTAFAHAISAVGEQLGRWWLRNPHIPRERIVAHHRDFCWAGASQLLDDRPRPIAGA